MLFLGFTMLYALATASAGYFVSFPSRVTHFPSFEIMNDAACPFAIKSSIVLTAALAAPFSRSLKLEANRDMLSPNLVKIPPSPSNIGRKSPPNPGIHETILPIPCMNFASRVDALERAVPTMDASNPKNLITGPLLPVFARASAASSTPPFLANFTNICSAGLATGLNSLRPSPAPIIIAAINEIIASIHFPLIA